MDRLNTRNILKRKKQKLEGNNYNCVLCPHQSEETIFHLFIECPFSQECWRHLGIQWATGVGFYPMMDQAKEQAPHPFFMEIFTLAAWQICNGITSYSTGLHHSSKLGSRASLRRLHCKRIECSKTKNSNSPHY
ncbi:hypothetical protein PR202_ga31663 [Eleusine coracana subsp. coracana]|uniref:Reverse transcriptase zinc-binding domain-containing protein n=1 Tax=Eleusine coracana subsp. coracana TaxID=191504 RepID=A0AAV5DS31_ELECO|nr:hypothetical protein PR202_ga31663 [Eleusine coracana subsp. coracana]